MYLHIGKGKTVKEERIIGIFDLDTSTVSSITKDFLNKKEKKGLMVYEDYDLPRSFVLCKEKEDSRVILSRISSVGLRDRAESGSDLIAEQAGSQDK